MREFKDELMDFVYERKAAAFVNGREDEIFDTIRDLSGVIGVLMPSI